MIVGYLWIPARAAKGIHSKKSLSGTFSNLHCYINFLWISVISRKDEQWGKNRKIDAEHQQARLTSGLSVMQYQLTKPSFESWRCRQRSWLIITFYPVRRRSSLSSRRIGLHAGQIKSQHVCVSFFNVT